MGPRCGVISLSAFALRTSIPRSRSDSDPLEGLCAFLGSHVQKLEAEHYICIESSRCWSPRGVVQLSGEELPEIHAQRRSG